MSINDLLAKLLANENLTIVRGDVHTASFDIKNRTLVLPQWQNIEQETEEMLILHEVGHALFTGDEYIDAIEKEGMIFKSYMNIIEDVRIERKMKERYPGSKKSFLLGYKQLRDKDFFGIADRNVNELNLIDRINMFYKAGVQCGVKFTNAEWNLVRQVDAVNTIEDVERVAHLILKYSQDAQEEQTSSIENLDLASLPNDGNEEYEEEEDDLDQQLNSGNYEEYEDEDEEYVDETDEYGTKASEESMVYEDARSSQEDSLMPVSQRELDKNLEHAADTNTIFQYFDVDFCYKQPAHQAFKSYKVILKDLEAGIESRKDMHFYSYVTSVDPLEECKNFKYENAGIINSMVKEFEMRKSASSWKRAKTSKTGQLDPKKLFGYKIKDELFKQLTIVKEGKKHGMVFLLDWSGSMDNYIGNTIKQLINLVLFARKINIPFRVFAFTTEGQAVERVDPILNPNGLGRNDSGTLLEFFNEKMTERETNAMIGYMLCHPYVGIKGYGLGGTPLNESLIYMMNYMKDFIINSGVEKPIFITLTDGEGSSLYGSEKLAHIKYIDTQDGQSVRKYVKSFFKDSLTGKDYAIDRHGDSQTRALLNILRDRYGVHTIGFNIVNNNYRAIRDVVVASNGGHVAYDIQLKLRSKKCIELAYSGYDQYYLLDNKSLKVFNDVDLSSVTQQSTALQASKLLGKTMNRNKASRYVMNRFAVTVA